MSAYFESRQPDFNPLSAAVTALIVVPASVVQDASGVPFVREFGAQTDHVSHSIDGSEFQFSVDLDSLGAGIRFNST